MMDQLIAELEAAPEGSRKLDGPLFRLHIMPGTDWEKNKGLWWPCETTFCERYEVRPYTTSLDAAMTLVPEGLCWEVEAGPKIGAVACVGTRYGPMEGTGTTPALTLCIAALRARQAMEAT